MAGEKKDIVRLFIAELAREIDIGRRAAIATHEAATHEEARPENDKDTRALEASYLAGAQAARVRDLERAVNALEFMALRDYAESDAIGLSAIVDLDRDGESSRYLVAPLGGGTKITLAGTEIQIVTPASPLGRALLGKTVGDVATVHVERQSREYEITRVA